MKKVILTLSAVALVGAYASSASAQCDFNAIAKAKGIKGSMVRMFSACPSTEHPMGANTATGGGVPACSPVALPGGASATDYSFEPTKGGCSVQTKAAINKDCGTLKDANGDDLGLPTGPCHVTSVSAKCSGILEGDGLTLINAADDAGWSLGTLTRATLNDATNGDMTVLDFPVLFDFGDPANGSMKLKSSSAIALAAFVSPTAAALPTCTSLEVVKVFIKDPNGKLFANLGQSTRDKAE